jgi:hypothetical protein
MSRLVMLPEDFLDDDGDAGGRRPPEAHGDAHRADRERFTKRCTGRGFSREQLVEGFSGHRSVT